MWYLLNIDIPLQRDNELSRRDSTSQWLITDQSKYKAHLAASLPAGAHATVAAAAIDEGWSVDGGQLRILLITKHRPRGHDTPNCPFTH